MALVSFFLSALQRSDVLMSVSVCRGRTDMTDDRYYRSLQPRNEYILGVELIAPTFLTSPLF
jgi:hypothetical protein